MTIQDDTTLEEVALEIVTSIYGAAVAKHSKTAVLMVVFYRWDRGPEEQMPYTETIGTFRILAHQGYAKMVISDGSGGTPVKPKTPELV